MKVLLAYGYSQKNAGDLAITLGALDILVSNGHEVVILSRYNKSSVEYFNSSRTYLDRYGDKITILECPFTLNRNASIFRTMVDYFHGVLFLSGLRKSKEVDFAIQNSDLVVFNGGNLLRCSSLADYIRLKALFYPLKRSKKMNKEYIIFPQSTARIKWFGIASITEAISNAKAVYIREELSYKKLIGEFNFTNLRRSLDCAFFIEHSYRWKQSTDDNRKVIGFTFRAQTVGDLSEFSQEDQDFIVSTMLEAVEHYRNSCTFRIIIQTVKDISISNQFLKAAKQIANVEIEVVEEYEPTVLLKHLAELDLLIGMRLHSIILALSCGTPCYGVFYSEWGLKNEGLMREFNLPFTILDSSDNTIDIKSVDTLLDNGGAISSAILNLVDDGRQKLRELI